MHRSLPLILSAGLLGCSPAPEPADNALWQEPFPEQYASWLTTDEDVGQEDELARRPAMVVLWAGSGFAKDYNTPRGHRYAVSDVTHTLRTGVPPKGPEEKGYSASCWTCKTPDAPRLMAEMGEQAFAASDFTSLGTEMANTVGCADCHQPESSALHLARPHARKAMEKIHLPFEQQTPAMQGAQTCGQCHVTYYFQPEAHNQVNIPWIFGSTADEIERYYDTRRFYEWLHPISRTPMLKARHPDFETWSRSPHAEAGATCIDCHMPERSNAKGHSYTDHNVGQALANFDDTCAGCHESKGALSAALAKNKAEIEAARNEVESLLVKAHYEAKAAWDAGAQWAQMDSPIMDIRHAQWRWDFAVASHGIHAHNPEEGLALLAVARQQANMARAKLELLHEQLGVTEVYYPDLSSKAAAQASVGMDMARFEAEKAEFIRDVVAPRWPAAAMRGAPH
ncbi:ammonia-forming cytochrome c nitrite reductase subunit c552 [Ferrimonas balearica]|uniref:ammonia-forming cytochrome c nitrite reductase subunit c552 n=1 Tax=Ferrimonas balearica TaxID=44012 RepID=UPI001C9A1300|nr:ammonia-forming cytochrome c nitrite reductase subunit c552 [Ferrimonas balearica]MBY5921534.1 ammonia-forming cytochrome c nitrite reductase subunit c552 [Ferrimonas balearica]MBY5995126.1 ammonia-forming cytochrome c nitrite reductase subunit c552 [Ferrimonas balearica]